MTTDNSTAPVQRVSPEDADLWRRMGQCAVELLPSILRGIADDLRQGLNTDSPKFRHIFSVVQPVVPASANWRASQYGERWVVECHMPCINGLCAWVTVADLGQPELEDEMFGGLDREGIAKRIAAALSAAPASDADSMPAQPTKEN